MHGFAATLLSPVVRELLDRSDRVSDIETYRFPSSRRRHHEKGRHPVPAIVSVGDSASSFDPIYGQGMTSSALQAEALGRVAGSLVARDGAAGSVVG